MPGVRKPRYVKISIVDLDDDGRKHAVMQQGGLDPTRKALVRNGDRWDNRLLVQWVPNNEDTTREPVGVS